jgi:putative restriction endonuclease
MVACNLYFTLPFGQMHSRNPVIIALAHSLGRTPGSVAMKLVNFASLDPIHQARGILGLRGVSRADRVVWEEFRRRWTASAYESEKCLLNLLSTQQVEYSEDAMTLRILQAKNRPTETSVTVQIRTMQSFFRRAVLSAYQGRCCVTGNPVPELLVASHILPWRDFPDERINPKNGLCLVAHLDKAFDKGLITFGTDLKLKLSTGLLAYLPNEALERQFLALDGAPIRMPSRFAPEEGFLTYHRENLFDQNQSKKSRVTI